MLFRSPASSSPPSSSTSYSSRRIVQLLTVCPFESCANNLMKLVDLLAASYLLSSLPPASSSLPSSSTSYSSRRIVQLPTVKSSAVTPISYVQWDRLDMWWRGGIHGGGTAEPTTVPHRRNPQQCRTGATWDGYRRNNYTDCLLCTIFVALSDGYM